MNSHFLSIFCLILVCCTLSVAKQDDGFAIPKNSSYHNKKSFDKSSGHLKDDLGVLFEELAHGYAQEIERAAQASQKLYRRMRELAENTSKGRFSGAPHARLQQDLCEAKRMVDESRFRVSRLQEQNNFLEGI